MSYRKIKATNGNKKKPVVIYITTGFLIILYIIAIPKVP